MKIIPESEIDEAAELYTNIHLRLLVPEAEITNTIQDLYDYCIDDFKSGVEFAESKFEEIAIEFAKYLFSSEITRNHSKEDEMIYTPPEFNLMKGNLIKNGKEIFNNFLKERNDKI